MLCVAARIVHAAMWSPRAGSRANYTELYNQYRSLLLIDGIGVFDPDRTGSQGIDPKMKRSACRDGYKSRER